MSLFGRKHIEVGDTVSYTTYSDDEEITVTDIVSSIEQKTLDGPWFQQPDGSQATYTNYHLEGSTGVYDEHELTKETDLHEMSGLEFLGHLLFG